MIRTIIIGTAIAAAALITAPISDADPKDEADVPGIQYNAVLGAHCDNWHRYIFGRAPNGQALACVAFDGVGTWVQSAPLHGVQQVGAPCGSGDGAAQSADGQPLICVFNKGWSPGP